MNRVRVLLLGLLALFFCHDAVYAAGAGEIRATFNFGETLPVSPASTGSTPIRYGTHVEGQYENKPYFVYDVRTWSSQTYISGYVYACSKYTTSTGVVQYLWTGKTLSGGYYNTYLTEWARGVAAYNSSEVCEASVCDQADDDGDGVCNSCDISPGLPDKNPCIWYSAYTRDGYLAFRAIDYSGNCDGSLLSYYNNPSFTNQTVYPSISAHGNEVTIDPANCNGSDTNGLCQCGYPDSPGSPTEGLALTTDKPSFEEQINDAKNNPDDYDDCPSVKSRCDTACSSRGGTKTNTCTEDNGTVYMQCECQNEYAFNLQSPAETNSNNSSNDSDGDGIADSGDVDQTGGSDTNNDGTSDIYSAVKGAINDSGLTGKIDGTNKYLNGIGNQLGTAIGAINGMGSSIDGLGNKIDDVGSKITGMKDSLGSKLDDIKDKLDDGFEVTGDSALPDGNDYDSDVDNIDEDNLGEAIGNFISGGLPLVSYFQGTYIDIGSSSPALSTEIYGRTVSIDFTGLEDILNNMGLVLVAIATVLAFMIIVHKG